LFLALGTPHLSSAIGLQGLQTPEYLPAFLSVNIDMILSFQR
jgi:hypothetical protein